MGEASQGIFVGCLNNRVYARVVGRGTFQNSRALRQFALERIDQGQDEFVIDLGHCQGMDSTFLGILAVIGLRLRHAGTMATIRIVNVNPRNREVLQTLGLDRLFSIDGEPPATLADIDYHLLADTDVTQLKRPLDKVKTANLMVEAHDGLVRIDQRKSPRFRELARILRQANQSSTPSARSH
jgi:anti-sigma B factor antagonist